MRGIKTKLVASVFITALTFNACNNAATPEAKFINLFADLSVGVPHYKTFRGYSEPTGLREGHCIADFSQSEIQFREFATNLAVPPQQLLSSTITITANSKHEPKYPWLLQVQAQVSPTDTNTYNIHIEGVQPYD